MLGLAVSLASCSSDDIVKTPLSTPTISQNTTTVSSLSFSWTAVAGATQYAYELYDANGKVVLGDVTNTTSVIATGLTPNTTYTLKVWAYGALYGDKGTSPIAEITATTNAQIPLDAPVPVATSANGGVTITWPAVEHATAYEYSYEVDGETITGTTSTNSVTLTGLAIGEYTIKITATSSDETYSNSETISLTFQRTKAELWRKAGTYTSAALGQSFDATIVAYDDGSYTIESPYGEAGYQISFSVNSDNTITPIDHYAYSGGYYWHHVSSQYNLSIYVSSGYSYFEGDKDSGDVWFGMYLAGVDGSDIGDWGYDEFTWSTSATISVDDLVGSYSEDVDGFFYSSSWVSIPGNTTVTITKKDDSTIILTGFTSYWDTVTLEGTVDTAAKTITFAPQMLDSWYKVASGSGEANSVVATVSDNTITISNWAAYYDGYAYTGGYDDDGNWVDGITTTLTKK